MRRAYAHPFAPVAGAYRFQKELPDSQLVLMEDAGHFVYQDAPERTSEVYCAATPGSEASAPPK